MTIGRVPSLTDSKLCRVFIVDDHPVVLEGIKQWLADEPDLELCGQASTPDEALEAVERLEPDIVVADLTFEGFEGLDLIKDLKVRFPSLPILVHSILDESYYAERALSSGASGYLMKQNGMRQLLEGIRKARSGRIALSNRMAQSLLLKLSGCPDERASMGVQSLSDRELQVLRLIGEGISSREIAQQLHLSPKTIDTHREHLKAKLNLNSHAKLIQYAVRFVLDSP